MHSNYSTQVITVVGGTYREIDDDSLTHEVFGSGFRCCKYLLENSCKVKFHTSGNSEVENYLNENANAYENLSFTITPSPALITFKYSFALDNPSVFPGPPNIKKTSDINVDADDVIAYGLLESDCRIKSKRAVYDPQTAITPRKFSEFGTAEELVYIVNMGEASSIAESDDIDKIVEYFFKKEEVTAVIIKNGPYGATLYGGKKPYVIPSYITPQVHKIGSGDIFTASFAYYWMVKGLPFDVSASNASLSTAYFCDLQAYVDVHSLNLTSSYKETIPGNLSLKKIYLAAPFFTLADLILVEKVRNAFLAFGVNVFSPFHDVGLGIDKSVASKDLKGLDDADLVFCMLDHLDSGTLIESGYALAENKTIIGYHRTCNNDKLLMLSPGKFTLFDNLTTAIYHAIWNL